MAGGRGYEMNEWLNDMPPLFALTFTCTGKVQLEPLQFVSFRYLLQATVGSKPNLLFFF